MIAKTEESLINFLRNMEIRIFNGKKIKIRKLSNKDLKDIKEFLRFRNSLVKEEAKILKDRIVLPKEGKEMIKRSLKDIRRHKKVFLIAEHENKHENKIIGSTSIQLQRYRQSHVGYFVITIEKGYRGIGLGKYLTAEIIKLAKRELRPKPKIIRLSVFPDNKPAISLYKKYGFKKVAVVPKQYQYKGKLIDEIIMLLYL